MKKTTATAYVYPEPPPETSIFVFSTLSPPTVDRCIPSLRTGYSHLLTLPPFSLIVIMPFDFQFLRANPKSSARIENRTQEFRIAHKNSELKYGSHRCRLRLTEEDRNRRTQELLARMGATKDSLGVLVRSCNSANNFCLSTSAQNPER